MPASPQTNATAAELRQDLGAVAYERTLGSPDRGYIGLRVMPLFESAISAAKFPVVPADIGLKDVDDSRATNGNYNEIDWRFGMTAFSTEDRGLTGRVDDRLRALYRTFVELEQATTNTVTDSILLALERRIAALVELGGAAANVAVPWSTAATATPKADIDAGILAMRAAAGLLPNAVAMSWTAFKAAMRCAEVKDAIKYTKSPDEIGDDAAQAGLLAAYFGVPAVLVAGAQKDTAQKNKAMSLADVWTAGLVHLLRVSEGSGNVLEACYGRTILFTGGAPNILTVETYRDESRRSDIIRVRNDTTEFVQYAAAKYTIGNIV